MEGVCTRGSAGNQPIGKALPAFVPKELESEDEHVLHALKVDPARILLERALSARDKWIAVRCADFPAETTQRRSTVLASLSALSERLAPQRAAWRASFPAYSPSRELDFPLIHALASTLRHKGESFVKDMARGMPIAGVVHPTNVLPERGRPATLSIEDWKAGIPGRIARIVDFTQPDQGSTLAVTRWERTLDEVRKGWVTEPTSISDDMLKSIALTPRFAIDESRGDRVAKFRLIEDVRAIGVEAILSASDTEIPQDLDVFRAAASFYQDRHPWGRLHAFSVDYSHAYKNIPLREDQKGYAAIVLTPPEGSPIAARLRTQAFGAARAPANWTRVTRFAQWAMATLFGAIWKFSPTTVFVSNRSSRAARLSTPRRGQCAFGTGVSG